MENPYDTDFVKKQLREIYKPKNEDELDKIVKELFQKHIESERVRAEYRENHKFCPKCGAIGHSTTLMAYPFDLDRKEEYKDLNECTCSECGHEHTAHERVK